MRLVRLPAIRRDLLVPLHLIHASGIVARVIVGGTKPAPDRIEERTVSRTRLMGSGLDCAAALRRDRARSRGGASLRLSEGHAGVHEQENAANSDNVLAHDDHLLVPSTRPPTSVDDCRLLPNGTRQPMSKCNLVTPRCV